MWGGWGPYGDRAPLDLIWLSLHVWYIVLDYWHFPFFCNSFLIYLLTKTPNIPTAKYRLVTTMRLDWTSVLTEISSIYFTTIFWLVFLPVQNNMLYTILNTFTNKDISGPSYSFYTLLIPQAAWNREGGLLGVNKTIFMPAAGWLRKQTLSHPIFSTGDTWSGNTGVVMDT